MSRMQLSVNSLYTRSSVSDLLCIVSMVPSGLVPSVCAEFKTEKKAVVPVRNASSLSRVIPPNR